MGTSTPNYGKQSKTLLGQAPSPDFSVRRAKARSLSGFKSHPATVAPAGSNRSGGGGNEAIEAFGVEGHSSDLANMQAVTSSKR